MSLSARRSVTAVLGPTNTGKTHLAIERMCAHSSGIIGFPLRLLAREVYDRVVAIKGPDRVALVTGEEKITPPDARWFLCTAESMPSYDAAFVALDEAQLGADLERGHVFTDRLLHARGREETMLLGSEALRPMIRALVPEAEIVARPRFSTLTYAGAKKISRLPKRSVIVAFSAEEVYAVAEMLRRLRGGAAVVMGSLSPRTRNAQVAMFQAGEVDYLVATDAIGMGLNMDVAHVAFASLHKFDGRRRRRLTVAEMAQIAGRAGRHQRDGSFGALAEEGPGAFLPEEVLAIEEHRFPHLDHLFWREGDPDLSSIDALIADLERKPTEPVLRAAPPATDLLVLKRLADEPWVRDRARGARMVARLWAACGIPDFRKLGLDPHARFVERVFRHLSEGQGHVPYQWFADEIARLDTVSGDVETLAGRLAAIRSWAYIAQRPGWLADPAHWAERTRDIEEHLSDGLHASLTQRFVDKRTTALIRKIGTDAGALPVVVGAEGEVTVEDHPIGRLDGFRFHVDPGARAGDKRLLLAAAEKRLGTERARRADALVAAEDAAFSLSLPQTVVGEGAQPIPSRHAGLVPASTMPRTPPPRGARPGGPRHEAGVTKDPGVRGDPGDIALLWSGHAIATLAPGSALARPRVVLARDLDCLDKPTREKVAARLARWIEARTARFAPGLTALAQAARDPAASSAFRAVATAVEGAGGIAPRLPLRPSLDALSPDERRRLRKLGVTVGALDLFDARLLKPAAAAWRRALMAVRGEAPGTPAEGATVLPRGAPGATVAAGFRPLGVQAVRVDLVERVARAAHDAREGRKPFTPDAALATSIGLEPATTARLMAELGFHPAKGEAPAWIWRGRAPVRRQPVVPGRDNAFSGLSALLGHG